MGIPQVPDQVRRAPATVLRAVFAGIGRILMSADRAASAGPAQAAGTVQSAGTAQSADTVQSAGTMQSAGTVQPATSDSLEQQQQRAAQRLERHGSVPPAPPNSRWRSLDETGNVRLLSAADEAYDDPAPAAAEPEIAATKASEPALPLANYDSLSLASIRARLRGLDVGQLKVLLDYEARNAERPELLGMFERRIEKLESGG
jgi:hypothetical protein